MSVELANSAPTRHVDGPFGERFAFRRFGRTGGVPLVLMMRLHGTMDHWDPALLDGLAAEREVIVFDNRGLSASTGQPDGTVEGLVDGAITFIRSVGLSQVDLLGWSLGGIVAQGVALTAPGLVRRLVVAGSSPVGVPEMPAAPDRVWQTVAKPTNTDDDFLYLFFPETVAGRDAGLASLRRLDHRLTRSSAAISTEARRAQLAAIGAFAGYWDRLHELELPVLVANGTQDVMIDAYATFAMSRRLTNAKAVLYSDAGHGFLFHHAEDFADEVNRFLS